MKARLPAGRKEGDPWAAFPSSKSQGRRSDQARPPTGALERGPDLCVGVTVEASCPPANLRRDSPAPQRECGAGTRCHGYKSSYSHRSERAGELAPSASPALPPLRIFPSSQESAQQPGASGAGLGGAARTQGRGHERPPEAAQPPGPGTREAAPPAPRRGPSRGKCCLPSSPTQAWLPHLCPAPVPGHLGCLAPSSLTSCLS